MSVVQVDLAMSSMSWQIRAGPTLNFSQPVWLVVVLGGNGEGVEEHQDDDQPVKHDGLHSRATLPAAEAVPASPLTTGRKTDFNTASLIFSFCHACSQICDGEMTASAPMEAITEKSDPI